MLSTENFRSREIGLELLYEVVLIREEKDPNWINRIRELLRRAWRYAKHWKV